MKTTRWYGLLVAAAFSVPLIAQQQKSPGMSSAAPTGVHPAGSFVTVHGAKLWYESEGSGPPLVLIAGGPGYAHDAFHPWFSAFAAKHRIIYFDALGRGKSEHPKDTQEYTLVRDVEDLEVLRTALGLGKIDVLGHSYGGVVAQSYALRYPASVRHLILADTAFDIEALQAFSENLNRELKNQYPDVWTQLEQLRAKGINVCSKDRPEIAEPSLPLLYFYDPDNASKLRDAPFSMDVVCNMAGSNFDVAWGGDLSNFDLRSALKRLTMPTLIVAGRYDRAVLPRFSVQYKQFAPQAQFVMFEKSGHFPFVEEPEIFVRTVETFLSQP